MEARDVMTTQVITVSPDQTVSDIARLFVTHRISAVPVVDPAGQVVGIVSEGDLIDRADAGTRHRMSWWLEFLAGSERQAQAYLRAHGKRARDVMTRDVVSVDEKAPLAEIAALLEKRRIKRVPVLRGGKLVGIVSRANLLHGLVAQQAAPAGSASARELRAAVQRELAEAGIGVDRVNVVVSEDAVQLWGWVDSELERKAAGAAAEAAAGERTVENHVTVMPAQLKATYGGL
ncbi:MAG: CBS domain-containing protein [Burkholderiales bacterium]|nr:CBS domain-containing protein [Burkholderiales bacterium]